MIKFRKIALISFAFLGLFTIASCKKKTEEPVTNIIKEEDDEPNLSSITCKTDNVKKEFYLGETFTCEGLVVYANSIRLKEDNSLESIEEEVKNYSVNLENVDMDTCGVYPVEIIYRKGTKVVKSTYNITVKSTFLVESGVKYAGGLEITYDGEFKKELKLDEEFTFSAAKIKCRVHYFENGKEVEDKNIAYTKVTANAEAVRTDEVGTYVIQYTYEEELTINGQAYNNVVHTYTLVNVTNPVKSIEKTTEGDTTFKASTELLDYSQWKIRINREVERQTAEVSCTSDLFSITGGVSFIEGETTITIKLIEDPTKYLQIPITITPSDTQDILIQTDLSDQHPEDNGIIYYGDSGKIKSVNATKNEDRVSKGDSYETVVFNQRVTIKGSDSKFVITMDKPGVIVMFAASATDDGAEVTFFNAEGEELATATTPTPKQTEVMLRFEAPTAGEYYFTSSLSLYVHGFVLATNK